MAERMNNVPNNMGRTNSPVEENYRDNMPAVRDKNMGLPDGYRDDYRDIYRGYRHEKINKSNTNMFRDPKNYKKYNSAAEIFERIISHMTKGVMFHDKMMDLYGFLGLDGFKKIHEYQYYHESMSRRNLKCYMLEYLNLLAEDEDINDEGLQFIPQSWYGYTRHEVTPEMKKQHIMPSFQAYRDWEDETKELLSYCANELMYMGQVSDFNEITKMVKDVEEELKLIDALILKISSVDFDIKYVLDMQEDLCEEYEKKLEECFEQKIEEDEKKKKHRPYSNDEQAYARRKRSYYTGRYLR